MSERRAAFEVLLERLQRERDELRLQLHLGGKEARDEYERLSARVDELRKNYEPVKDAVGETATSVFSALGFAADELQRGLGRIRKALPGGRD